MNKFMRITASVLAMVNLCLVFWHGTISPDTHKLILFAFYFFVMLVICKKFDGRIDGGVE